MAIIKLPKEFHPDFSIPNKAPAGQVEVDWSNPITRGLKFFALPVGSMTIDVVSGHIGVNVGGIAYDNDTQGRVLVGNGSDSISFANIRHDVGTGPNTLISRFNWNGSSDSFSTAISLPNNSSLGMYIPNTQAQQLLGQDSTAGSTTSWNSTVTSDNWNTWGISHPGSGGQGIGYMDGRVLTVSNAATHNYDGGTFGVNLFTGQGGEFGRGKMLFSIVFNRQITSAEQAYIARNPYQLLKPKTDPVYFVPEAASGNVLAADSGTYTYTGAGAALTTDRILTADSGNYTYTGADATLTFTPVGDFTLTADAGAYTYTGTNTDLLKGSVIVAESGGYTYTGTAVTLTFGAAGDFTLSADSGSYVYNGTNVGLTADRLLSADSGSYAYTGTNVDLLKGFSLTAESGSYSYAGTSIDFKVTRVLQADSGIYNYNGTNVILKATGQSVWAIQGDTSTAWNDQIDTSTTWNIQ